MGPFPRFGLTLLPEDPVALRERPEGPVTLSEGPDTLSEGSGTL